MMKALYDMPFFWPGLYKRLVTKSFYNYSLEFIKRITTASFCDSYWYFQEQPITIKIQFQQFIRALLKKVLFQKYPPFKSPLLYDTISISFPDSEEFYTAAKEFLNRIFEDLGIRDSNIILDQLILPHNLFRIDNYFDNNIRIVVVDRDPRDVFILNKYVWSKNREIVPFPSDIHKFVLYYKKMRNFEMTVSDPRILRIHFEDLVYNYCDSINLLYSFLDINANDHTKRFTYFNPNLSIKNTQTYKVFPQARGEAETIERNLKEFLYPFPTESNY